MSSLRVSLVFVVAALLAAVSVAGAQNTGLPYVDKVVIQSAAGADRPICPTDSIWFVVAGTLPTPCYEVRIEAFPPLEASPLPHPWWVRLTVTPTDCEGGCAQVLQPFRRQIVLPALPTGAYELPLEVVDLGCRDSSEAPRVRQRFPFVVTTCDGPAEPCVFGGWVHRGPSICDASIAPGGTADVTFTVQSHVALAGLQGELHVFAPSDPRVSGPPLRIVKLTPVGYAEGMRLAWTSTTGGARFALFAESRAPIPGQRPWELALPPEVLRVTLEPVRTVLPEQTIVIASNLLGADIDGNGVPECAYRTFAPVQAVICAAKPAGCDFNGDGHLDIRDLVLMIRCLGRPEAAAPPLPCVTTIHDCNADGVRDLADVICCAREMLRSGCPDCPRDTLPHDAAVRAMFGTPRFADDEVVVPVRVEGWHALGGAMVRLAFPADRYDATVETVDVAGRLTLAETRDGEAALGLIRLSPETTPGDADVAVIQLRLKPGATHGGALASASGEFSDPDGQPLAATLDAALPLGGAGRDALSEGRPNPSSGETRFELSLDRAGSATLAVFDVGGRRVATLHDGPLAAGLHAFTWDGLGEGGRAAPSGIYFVRATTATADVMRKVIRLRP